LRAVRSNPGIARAGRSPALAALGRKCDERGEIVLVQTEARRYLLEMQVNTSQRFAHPAR